MTRRLAILLWGAAMAQCAEPIVPPKVSVPAAAPLVKVADYRMREARFGAGAAAKGDHLYIVGGSNEGSWVLDSIERLDCRTGATAPFARLQAGRLWHGVVVVGRTMYVLGGETTTTDSAGRMAQSPDDSVELVDLATGKVSRGVALPEPRRSFGCVLLGNRIYVFGGLVRTGNKSARTNSTIIFDLETQRWSQGAPMPTPREAEAALLDGPLIVVPGGYDGRVARVEVELFNPRANTWGALPPLCRPASSHSLAFLGHHLFLFGHYDAPEQCLAYDLSTRQSEPMVLPFKGARHTAAVVHQGKIYVIGGRGENSPDAFDVIQVFALRSSGSD